MDILVELLIEQIVIYGIVILICIGILYVYLKKQRLNSKRTEEKVALSKLDGLFEPVSLHPYIDLTTCIGSGACVAACPEKDILGLVDGKATAIHASNCVGHGACFHACPVEAISLRIGTESRGVDLPHVNEHFETNVQGIYIAGELGGMGLIKNSVEQGDQAIQYIAKKTQPGQNSHLDVLIIGAGPAGISATLAAKKYGLKSLTLEQDSLGGTVYSFPRDKIVMTSPMDLPLHGKIKLFNTSKQELLDLWQKVIAENAIEIIENTKVEQIIPQPNSIFKIITSSGDIFFANNVLLAIGRRGTPRKLNIPGENLPKVAYRLLEPENITGKNILVVGGGDSAIESALLLMDQNDVILSYRKDKFSRLKPKNRERIIEAIENKKLNVLFNSHLLRIDTTQVEVNCEDIGETLIKNNDLVYIFVGGELPISFLEKAGVRISRRFGYIMKKHN